MLADILKEGKLYEAEITMYKMIFMINGEFVRNRLQKDIAKINNGVFCFDGELVVIRFFSSNPV